MNLEDMKNGHLPAHPTPINGRLWGLTKREAFAMAAMQGLLAAKPQADTVDLYFHTLGICAVKAADAVLKALDDNPA